MTAVVQAGDRLLARVAALREADRALLEPRLGRHHTVVELAAESRCSGEDPEPLERVLADLLRALGRLGVDQLDGRDTVVAGGNELVSIQQMLIRAEHHGRGVLLDPDLAFRREPRAEQLARQALAGLGLGEQQKVVLRPPPDDHRRRRPRAFGVSSSASHDSPTGSSATSLETIRFQVRRGVRRPFTET